MRFDLDHLSDEDFEVLSERLLVAKGFVVISRPSRGPDRGRDMLATRSWSDEMRLLHEELWLIECKHFAKGGGSVREKDIGNFETRMKVHEANRYLLITSSVVSETVKNQLESLTRDRGDPRMATFWNQYDIQNFLSEHPEVYTQLFSSWDQQAAEAVMFIRKHYPVAHRGAFLWCPGVTALFENRVRYETSIDRLRLKNNLMDIGIKDLGFSISEDENTWVFLVDTDDAVTMDKLAWDHLNPENLHVALERKEAFNAIWQFHVNPVNTKCG